MDSLCLNSLQSIDSARHADVISLPSLKNYPALLFAYLEPISSPCPTLRAASCASEMLGFSSFTVQSGDISGRIDTLVQPSLGPDQILLEKAAMTWFGAVLVWKNERLTSGSSKSTTPATHHKVSTPKDSSTSSCRVDYFHRDAVEHYVVLRARLNIRPRHA